ncbi:hypothetical protein BS78_06G201900 [Paspalum vaginatum]|nr:hypothetical protein BS78_06G201900 [Paspalum vaginatum]
MADPHTSRTGAVSAGHAVLSAAGSSQKWIATRIPCGAIFFCAAPTAIIGHIFTHTSPISFAYDEASEAAEPHPRPPRPPSPPPSSLPARKEPLPPPIRLETPARRLSRSSSARDPSTPQLQRASPSQFTHTKASFPPAGEATDPAGGCRLRAWAGSAPARRGMIISELDMATRVENGRPHEGTPLRAPPPPLLVSLASCPFCSAPRPRRFPFVSPFPRALQPLLPVPAAPARVVCAAAPARVVVPSHRTVPRP